jgi:hypothetical protein
MYQKEGYWDVKPKIKALSFPKRGKFEVTLQDGRSITMPISAFPSMKKVPVKERNNWYLMGGQEIGHAHNFLPIRLRRSHGGNGTVVFVVHYHDGFETGEV